MQSHITLQPFLWMSDRQHRVKGMTFFPLSEGLEHHLQSLLKQYRQFGQFIHRGVDITGRSRTVGLFSLSTGLRKMGDSRGDGITSVIQLILEPCKFSKFIQFLELPVCFMAHQ